MIKSGFNIKNEIKWVDTIEKGAMFDVNDLVESYNEFHKTCINARTFGKLEEVKTNFETKRVTIQKKKHTIYMKN